MSAAKRQADALLTDHFTYTPLSLIDDIINAVNQIVYHALDALEDGLLAVPPAQLGFRSQTTALTPAKRAESTPRSESTPSGGETSALLQDPARDKAQSQDAILAEQARDEIENGVHALETLLESTVDKNFDKFEIWILRNILTVPEDLAAWVRLSHYEGLQLPQPKGAPTPESILQLRRTVAETRKMNAWLKATHDTHQEVLSRFKEIVSTKDRSKDAPHATTPGSKESSEASKQRLNLSFLSNKTSFSSSSSSFTSTSPLSTGKIEPSPGPASTNITDQARFVLSQLPVVVKIVKELGPKLQRLKELDVSKMDLDTRRQQRREYIERGVQKIVDTQGNHGAGQDNVPPSSGNIIRRRLDEVTDLESLVGGLRDTG